MGRYIVLYHAPESAAWGMANATPEDMKKGFAAWMAWAESCGDALVDMGSPLAGGQRLTASGSSPAESNPLGYSVLEAEDMAGAQALLADHPHLGWAEGCAIEVYEAAQPPHP